MAIKVYGSPVSLNVGSVLITLYEKDVSDFQNVNVNMMIGEQKQQPYLAKQPFGEIPCIEDGDFTLFESRAIARYLAEKFSGQGSDLYPEVLPIRAVVDQWLEVQVHAFFKTLSVITHQRWFGPTFTGSIPNEEIVAEHLKELSRILDIYDAHLSTNKYLAGDFFSLAEITHLTSINYLLFAAPKEGAELLRSKQHVQAWWEDITSRPSWTKYFEVWKAAVVETGLDKTEERVAF